MLNELYDHKYNGMMYLLHGTPLPHADEEPHALCEKMRKTYGYKQMVDYHNYLYRKLTAVKETETMSEETAQCGGQMPEWYKKTMQERDELEVKLLKLEDFLASEKPLKLTKATYDLLSIQRHIMKAYVDILDMRLCLGMLPTHLIPSEDLPHD